VKSQVQNLQTSFPFILVEESTHKYYIIPYRVTIGLSRTFETWEIFDALHVTTKGCTSI
jgi:hypothetical protein